MSVDSGLIPEERQSLPFNGDRFVCSEFIKLKNKFNIKTVVELGSCVFGSTKWFAENFDKAITVEVSDYYRNIGLKRVVGFKNIVSFFGDSVAMLPAMLNMCDNLTVVFIDSQLQTLSLFNELKLIGKSGLIPSIVISGCVVPNEPNLEYNSYAGVNIGYDCMKPYFDDIYGVGKYDYHYNSDAESTEVKKGLIYVYPKKIINKINNND